MIPQMQYNTVLSGWNPEASYILQLEVDNKKTTHNICTFTASIKKEFYEKACTRSTTLAAFLRKLTSFLKQEVIFDTVFFYLLRTQWFSKSILSEHCGPWKEALQIFSFIERLYFPVVAFLFHCCYQNVIVHKHGNYFKSKTFTIAKIK